MAGRCGMREGYRRSVLRDWRRSGLSLPEFARARGLKYKTLWHWKRRLDVEGQADAGKETPHKQGGGKACVPAFLPVRVVDSADRTVAAAVTALPSKVEVVLRCGREIRFDESCSLPFLGSVVSLLEGC